MRNLIRKILKEQLPYSLSFPYSKDTAEQIKNNYEKIQKLLPNIIKLLKIKFSKEIDKIDVNKQTVFYGSEDLAQDAFVLDIVLKEKQELIKTDVFKVVYDFTGLNLAHYGVPLDVRIFTDPELYELLKNSKPGLVREDMNVDDYGRLHDQESKKIYPYKKISKLVNWFEKEYGDYAAKQGWSIFSSDSDLPKIKYKNEPNNKYNLFFQVQRIDDPMEGEALTGQLENDLVAVELAKKLGLTLDEYGVVVGWGGESYV